MDPELQLVRRKSFEAWKIYATTKLRRQLATRKAAYFYDVRLKQKALNSLLRNRTERLRSFCARLTIVPDEFPKFRTKDFHSKIIIKRVLRAWFAHSKNRRRKAHLNATVAKIRDKLIISKFLQDWKSICSEKKRNAVLEKKAIEFHQKSMQKKLLKSWIKDHNRRMNKRIKLEDAIKHHIRKVSNKMLHGWMKYRNNKIQQSNEIAKTQKFYESKLLRRSFNSIVLNVSRSIAARASHETAVSFYVGKLIRRILLVWRNYQRRKSECAKKIQVHRKNRESSSKHNFLRRWRLYVWEKKCARRRDNNAMSHYKKKTAITAFGVMKRYVLYKKQKAASLLYLESGIAQINLAVQRVYINKWRIALILFAQERQKFHRAEEHWSAATAKRYFFIWRTFSLSHKIRAKRKKKLEEIGQHVLLNIYLHRWRRKYAAVAIINEKEILASTIYAKKIKSRLWKSWKKYVDAKTKRRMETSEATKFRGQHELRDCSSMETSGSCPDRLGIAKKRSVRDLQIMRKSLDRWLEFLPDEENRLFRGFTSRKMNRLAYEIPYSTRLVIPEYMRRNRQICTTDLRDDELYERNRRMDNVEFNEIMRSYLPSEDCGSQSDDNSSAGSDSSNNSSAATYSIQSPVFARNKVVRSLKRFQ